MTTECWWCACWLFALLDVIAASLLVINLLLLLYSTVERHWFGSILSKFWSSWATVGVVDSSLCWQLDEEDEDEQEEGVLMLPPPLALGAKVNSWRGRRPKTLPIALLSLATLSILSPARHSNLVERHPHTSVFFFFLFFGVATDPLRKSKKCLPPYSFFGGVYRYISLMSIPGIQRRNEGKNESQAVGPETLLFLILLLGFFLTLGRHS